MKWYFTIHRPKMKAHGGAFWPIMLIQDLDDANTIEHEETHMKSQLYLGLVPWLLLYVFFLIFDGYYLNPFEMYARAVANKVDNFTPYGWTKYA